MRCSEAERGPFAGGGEITSPTYQLRRRPDMPRRFPEACMSASAHGDKPGVAIANAGRGAPLSPGSVRARGGAWAAGTGAGQGRRRGGHGACGTCTRTMQLDAYDATRSPGRRPRARSAETRSATSA